MTCLVLDVFAFFFIGVGLCQGVDFALNEPDCSPGSQLTVYSNRDTSLTCSGFDWTYNIYWSLTTPSNGAEHRLGDCRYCWNGCPACYQYDTAYTFTRTANQVTIRFRGGGDVEEGARLKCSSFRNSSAVSCSLTVRYEFSLSPADCSSDRNQVTVRQGAQTSLTCSGLGRASSIYWSLTKPSATEHRIGDCTGCGIDGCPQCSTYVQDAGYVLERSARDTTIRFVADWERQDEAIIKCSSFNNVTKTSCRLRVWRQYKMPQCQAGTLDLVEDDQNAPTVTCTQLSPDQTMHWVVNIRSAGAYQAVTCSACGEGQPCPQQCQGHQEGLRADRTLTNTTLTIVGNVRAWARQELTCFMSVEIKTSCIVRVLHYSRLSDPTVTLHSNWTVTGSVTFHQAYASDGGVECAWYRARDNGQTERIDSSAVTLSTNQEQEGGQMFYAGSCVMVTSLTTSEGLYNFTADLRPSSGPLTVGSVTIKKPGVLETEENSCPPVIVEGQNISCTCQHPVPSQPVPPASITWVNSTATPSSVLYLRDISRQETGRVYVCRSQWGPGGEISHSVEYSFDVVYGPLQATVTLDERPLDDLQSLTLTCTIEDVFPSAIFSWGGLTCANVSHSQANSTCVVDSGRLNGVTEVVCLVVNSKFPALNVTAYFTPPSPEKQTTDESSLPIIVGAVAGVVVVAVIITVIVIVVMRRKKGRSVKSPKPWATTPNSSAAEISVEYVNDMYESSDTLKVSTEPQTVTANTCATNSSHYVDDSSSSPCSSSATDTVYRNIAHDVTSGKSGPSENETVSEHSTLGMSVSGDVYAQVQKKPKKQTRKDKSRTLEARRNTQDEGNVYAQVEKKEEKKKATENQESCETSGTKKEPSERDQVTVNQPDSDVVYENYGTKGQNSEDVYMNVDQLSSSTTDSPGEVYNRLQFDRAGTEEHNPLYNHLAQR